MGGVIGEAVSKVRIGLGYDSHRFDRDRKLILGGLEIPAAEGLLGHSDADVLVHAVCDALLGALGKGDLGRHFPDTDPSLQGISSMKILESVVEMMVEQGYRLDNLDSTVIAEAPRLAGYIPAMAANMARAIRVKPDCVNIKATTNEKMGFIGRGEGIAALAVVLLTKNESVRTPHAP